MIKVFCYKHNRSKQHWAVCSVYTSDSYFSVSKCPKGYRLFKQIIQRSHSNTTLTTVLIPCCQCHLNVMRHVHIDLILFAALRWWKEIITLKGTFISIFCHLKFTLFKAIHTTPLFYFVTPLILVHLYYNRSGRACATPFCKHGPVSSWNTAGHTIKSSLRPWMVYLSNFSLSISTPCLTLNSKYIGGSCTVMHQQSSKHFRT